MARFTGWERGMMGKGTGAATGTWGDVTGVNSATLSHSLHAKGQKFSYTARFIFKKQPTAVHKHFFPPAPLSYKCYLNKHLHFRGG